MVRDPIAFEARAPVVFAVNGIGDNVLALPTLRALALIFDGRATLVHGTPTAGFLFDDARFTRRLCVPSTVAQNGRVFDAVALTNDIGECDLFVSVVTWYSPSLAWLIDRLRPRLTVGFAHQFDVWVAFDQSMHVADSQFSLVRRFEPRSTISSFAAPPPIPSWARETAAQLRTVMPHTCGILAVHTEAVMPRSWTGQPLRQVIDLFCERFNEFIVVIVGLGRSPWYDDGAFRVIPCHGLPLEVACGLVASADYFLGVDSCMLHVADAWRVPGVGLFGPSDPRRWGFRFGPHIVLRPGTRMDDLSVSDVVTALAELVDRYPDRRQRIVSEAARPQLAESRHGHP